MDVKAIIKGVRISPIKLRLMADVVRGKSANEAKAILNNYNSKPARILEKALDSAIANAVNNNKADINTLYVKEARVDAGPVMKRVMFDSRSHIGHNDKRTSHIIITVASK